VQVFGVDQNYEFLDRTRNAQQQSTLRYLAKTVEALDSHFVIVHAATLHETSVALFILLHFHLYAATRVQSTKECAHGFQARIYEISVLGIRIGLFFDHDEYLGNKLHNLMLYHFLSALLIKAPNVPANVIRMNINHCNISI
jgi:hypothetical protein